MNDTTREETITSKLWLLASSVGISVESLLRFSKHLSRVGKQASVAGKKFAARKKFAELVAALELRIDCRQQKQVEREWRAEISSYPNWRPVTVVGSSPTFRSQVSPSSHQRRFRRHNRREAE